MKKIALAAALSLAASTAFAGGIVEPTMVPGAVVKPAATSSSSAGILVPLLALVVLAAALSK